VGEREGGYWLLATGYWLLATGYWLGLGLGPNIVYSSFTSGEHSGVGLLRGMTKAKERLSFFLVFWLDNDLSVLANCTSHLPPSLSAFIVRNWYSFIFILQKKNNFKTQK
jgi:hypothetical protein